MIVPEIALKHLTAPRRVKMVCKPLRFSKIVLAASECGTYEFYKDEKFALLYFAATPEAPARIDYIFYRGDFTNFAPVNAQSIRCDDPIRQQLLNIYKDCGEQYFKIACALLHVTPDGKYLEVIDAILNAVEPKKAKFATLKIKREDFKKAEWDVECHAAMRATQMYKLRDPAFRARFLEVAKIATEKGVEARNVFFYEATEEELPVEAVPATDTTPAIEAKRGNPADLVWGTGGGVKGLFDTLVAEGNTARIHKQLADPKNLEQREPKDCIIQGKNGLGDAMKWAFVQMVCEDYSGTKETMNDFITRIMESNGFDYFTCPAKRTLDEDDTNGSAKRHCSDSRTGSVEEGEVLESKVTDSQPMDTEESKPTIVDLTCDEEMGALTRTVSVEPPTLSRSVSEEPPQLLRTISGPL
jgi:predicted NAD-dependent protein-ADP-ribosyltransferase YbiA (DUF1768 family)